MALAKRRDLAKANSKKNAPQIRQLKQLAIDAKEQLKQPAIDAKEQLKQPAIDAKEQLKQLAIVLPRIET